MQIFTAKRSSGRCSLFIAPMERTKKAAWLLIAPSDPFVARYYALSGIEHLAGEN